MPKPSNGHGTKSHHNTDPYDQRPFTAVLRKMYGVARPSWRRVLWFLRQEIKIKWAALYVVAVHIKNGTGLNTILHTIRRFGFGPVKVVIIRVFIEIQY